MRQERECSEELEWPGEGGRLPTVPLGNWKHLFISISHVHGEALRGTGCPFSLLGDAGALEHPSPGG